MMNETHEPGTYTIRIKGHLSQQWAGRFEGMTPTFTEGGETHLTGQVTDQAALHGLLRTIRDAGLELLSVNREA
jgi:hypothetical protein